MKTLLQQYAAYNIWANQRMLEVINALPEEIQVKQVASSFNSLHATLMHMLDAESIWWQRLKMHELITRPSETFKGSTRDVGNALLQQNMLWEAWITNATESALEHVFHYQNSKKEQFKQPTFQMLLHLFNHDTYHRGQLVTILRALDIQTIPATDFIVWSRRKESLKFKV